MDSKEFRQRIVPLYRPMYAVAVKIIGNADDASDVVQEAMEHLWEKRELLDGVRSMEAYAMTVLRRCAIDAIRRDSPTVTLDAVADPPSCDAAEDGVEALMSIIDSLPPGQRTVIRLTALDGRDVEEVAALTGYTKDNVRQLLSLSRKKIKEIYTKLIK